MTQKTTDPAQIAWFRDAAPYINAHRGRRFVLMFDGAAVLDEGFADLIHDIALLSALGVRLVLVHGARPQIEAGLREAGQALHYHGGLRVTDDKALEVVKAAVGAVRVEIEARLSASLVNTPMSGARLRVASGNFVTARPLGVREGVDLGHTGEVRRVDVEALRAQLELGHIVLLSPLGYSPTGEAFNLRAEEVATATAAALHSDKLIFLTETVERRALPDALTLEEAQALLQRRKSLGEETRQYLNDAITATLNGVRRTHLVSRKVDGALLRELYSRDGIGTLVTAETYEGLREARIEDVGGILELIAPLEAQGALVRRSREQLELEIRHFTVIERDGAIIGCASLYPFKKDAMGELACLAIHPDYQKGGRGDDLLKYLEGRAEKAGLKQLFALSTHTLHWFRERGFVAADIKALPMAKRSLYNYQRNSKAFIKTLA